MFSHEKAVQCLAREFNRPGINFKYKKWVSSFKQALPELTAATNAYYEDCWNLERKLGIRQHRRYVSTINEEFICRLIYADAIENGFMCGNTVPCLTTLNPRFMDGTTRLAKANAVKNIDIAVYFPQEIMGHMFNVPVVGVETKAYMDQTMFREFGGTARELRDLSPNIYYAAAPCDNAMSKTGGEHVRSLYIHESRVFFLRNQFRCHGEIGKPLDHEVVSRLVESVRSHLGLIRREDIVLNSYEAQYELSA
jgi:hypothetical protein